MDWRDTGEAERQAVKVKLDFHAAADSKRKQSSVRNCIHSDSGPESGRAGDARIEQVQSGSPSTVWRGSLRRFALPRGRSDCIVFRRHFLLLDRNFVANNSLATTPEPTAPRSPRRKAQCPSANSQGLAGAGCSTRGLAGVVLIQIARGSQRLVCKAHMPIRSFNSSLNVWIACN